MTTAGRVDFPTHMKTVHQDWLDQTGTDTVTSSMVDVMNAALGTNPHAATTAYEPTDRLNSMDTAVAAFNSRVDALDPEGSWEDAVDAAVTKADGGVFDDTYLDADVTAFGNNLDDQIENIVLPRFQGGMRDVNAVMSSAFVIGESTIEAMRNRDVAKYATELRIKNNFQRNDFVLKGAEAILRDTMSQVEMEKSVAHYTVEAKRLRIVAEKEQRDVDISIGINAARWDLETFQYGANLLASIGGGTVVPSGAASSSPSKAQSALGGALAGAAVGSSVGGGWGALIGGALGGISGLL